MGLFNRNKDKPELQGRVIGGVQVQKEAIGIAQIKEAAQTLKKYKEGKANLEQKIVENEQWYKMRHWECMRKADSDIKPTSAWLFNCIATKHSEAMSNIPTCNVLPREEGDKAESEKLSSIIPVILDQCDFEKVYSDIWDDKLKAGTGVYGVFWNSSKLNGLGDIEIKCIDILNLFYESGISDIQKSKNVFHCELADNDMLKSLYPQLGNLGGSTFEISKYIYDDSVDTTNKSCVVDWYYKKCVGGKTILHYCKFVNDTVLFATENMPEYAEKGWYDDGEYPFIFDVLFPVKGTPAGFGIIDVGKDCQSYIDRGNQAIMSNMLANSSPRFFIRNDGGVNEEEFADMSKPFVHTDSNLGQDSILPINGKPLSSIYVQVIKDKIDELKETTGNRDVSNGGSTGGVTAASAIAAMQEAGSKLSRDSNQASYRAFRRLCLMVIERIRQFYDLPRCFRIMGEDGIARYIQYSNAGIVAQEQGMDFGVDMGVRLPLFDISVSAEKQSPYSKLSQNELALQFYQLGFFAPSNADMSLACLEIMDFDRKEFIMQKISQNGTMYQMMMQMQQQMIMLAQMVDASRGSNLAEQLMAQFGGGAPVVPIDGASPNVEKTEALGGNAKKESKVTENARKKVADATSPT